MKLFILPLSEVKGYLFMYWITNALTCIAKNSAYHKVLEITQNLDNADIVLIPFQNTSEMIHSNILNYIYLNEDEKKLNVLTNKVFYNFIMKFIKQYQDKKILIYTRADQSDLFCYDYLLEFLSQKNVKLLIKDYIGNYANDEKFLYDCMDLYYKYPVIQKFFDINKFPHNMKSQELCNINRRKVVDIQEYKEKIFLYTLLPKQYSFFIFENYEKKCLVNTFQNNILKKYNVFYCKHQRNTPDGVARKYLKEIVLPEISKNISNVVYFESISTSEYNKYLEDSKIVVSCYGLGERVADDNLALFYETVVIRPDCSIVHDYFNTFNNNKFNSYHKIQFNTDWIVQCKPDFSDLEEKIKYVLNNWDSYLEKLRKGKEILLKFLESNQYETDFVETIYSACEK